MRQADGGKEARLTLGGLTDVEGNGFANTE